MNNDIKEKYFCLFDDNKKDNRIELFNKTNGYVGILETDIYYNDAFIGASFNDVWLNSNSYCGSVRNGRKVDDLFTNCAMKKAIPYKNVMLFAYREGIIPSIDIELDQNNINEMLKFFKEYFCLLGDDTSKTNAQRR